jgi:hypothetical protein
MDDLAPAGHVNQSASEIPADGVPITTKLCLRCKRESGRRQGFSRGEVFGELSRPLNGYDLESCERFAGAGGHHQQDALFALGDRFRRGLDLFKPL